MLRDEADGVYLDHHAAIVHLRTHFNKHIDPSPAGARVFGCHSGYFFHDETPGSSDLQIVYELKDRVELAMS